MTTLQSPVLDLNGEFLTESGSIIHRLISDFPSDALECPAGTSSVFWSHFSEGSLMSLLQTSVIVEATSAGWARGTIGNLDESQISGVTKYSKWLTVRRDPFFIQQC